MKIAIIGLAGTGKSTLFRILTGVNEGRQRGYTSGVGVAEIEDPRLYRIAELHKSRKITRPHVEIHDFDGFGRLWKEQKAGEIQNQLPGFDALVQVVGGFEPHDPTSDFEEIDMRLILADLAVIERSIKRLEKEVKAHKGDPVTFQTLKKLETSLAAGKGVSEVELTETELKSIKGFGFLTALPRIVVINIPEDMIGQRLEEFEELMKDRSISYIYASLPVEEEIWQLPPEDRIELLKEYGLEEPLPSRLFRALLNALNYITFFTAGEKEARAWLLRKGSTAAQAAGKIHTDMEKGFIRAEVYAYDDLVKYGSEKALKEKGLARLEGRDYIVKDGDILLIRFSK